MVRGDHGNVTAVPRFAQVRFRLSRAPTPCVTKPYRRQEMERRRFRSAVLCANPNQNVARVGFCVLDLDVEETVFGKRTGVPDFEFARRFGTRGVYPNQLLIGKTRLRITL